MRLREAKSLTNIMMICTFIFTSPDTQQVLLA